MGAGGKLAASSCVGEAAWEPPQENAQGPEQMHNKRRQKCIGCYKWKTQETRNTKWRPGREDAHLDPLLTGGCKEAHSTLHPGSGEAGCLHHPLLPGQNSKTTLKTRILIFFHLYFLTGRKRNEHKLRHTLRFRVKMQHHLKEYNNKKNPAS